MTTIQYWACLECGKDCQRKAARGQRPKYCGSACATRYGVRKRLEATSYICLGCNAEFRPNDYRDKYCTHRCAVNFRGTVNKIQKREKPKSIRRDMRSPIRRSYEDGDFVGLLKAIRFDTKRVDDCWEWQRSVDEDGYPVIHIGRKKAYVHRLAVEAYHGKPLGSQQAHHACSNRPCVNPEHVVPVTAAANMAEMKARQSYLARIDELEGALAELSPSHPLLGVLELY